MKTGIYLGERRNDEEVDHENRDTDRYDYKYGVTGRRFDALARVFFQLEVLC